MSTIKYNLAKEKRPMYTNYQRIICKLYKLPFIWRYVAKYVKSAYGLDRSVSLTSGFLCQSLFLSVGKKTSLSDLYRHGSGPVEIGNHVSISQGCKFITGLHDLKDFNIVVNKTIKIEDYSWIARDATILTGVTIGRGAVVGARSVVRNSVPPYAVVYGNPCKVIGFRYTPEEIIEFEKSHFPENERIPIDKIQKNYEKYFLKRIMEIKKFVEL